VGKGWEPARYLDMPAGERALVRAFLLQELEDRREAARP